MATLNKVMLIGRLTDNPEPPRTLPSGNTVIKFRFAVGRSRKNPQTGQWENDPNPLYIDCEAYSRPDTRRNLPELIHQFARKGDPLYIEGRLQLDQWEDKNGGGKRSKHKVVVESIEFLGSRNPDGPPPSPINRAASRPNTAQGEEDMPDSYNPDTPPAPQEDEDPIPF